MDRVAFFFDGWEPIARIVVVGVLGYTALVVLLRAAGKRTMARMNTFDFLLPDPAATVAMLGISASAILSPVAGTRCAMPTRRHARKLR